MEGRHRRGIIVGQQLNIGGLQYIFGCLWHRVPQHGGHGICGIKGSHGP